MSEGSTIRKVAATAAPIGAAEALASGQNPLTLENLSGVGTLKRRGELISQGTQAMGLGDPLGMALQQVGLRPKTPAGAGGVMSGQKMLSEGERQGVLDSRTAALAKAREGDLARGAELGQKLFGEGALGRLAEGRADETGRILSTRQGQADVAGNRSGNIQDVIARRKSALQGLNAPELNAFREQALGSIGQQEQTALRALKAAQGASGVRGGAALGQNVQLMKDFQQQKANAERDLFLKNVSERQNALNAFEQSATGAEGNEFNRTQTAQGALENATAAARQEELNRQQFNIGQQQQEKFGQLAAQLGLASMGQSERAAAAQGLLGEQQLTASQNLANKTGKK